MNDKQKNVKDIADAADAVNALARGKVIERVEDADVIFTADEEGIKKALAQEPREKSGEPRIITQWDLDVFMSDLI